MLEIVNYNRDEYNFPALIVLGCFDAIHIGHAELLKKAKLQAKINGLDMGVMMFAEGKGGRQIFTFEERLALLEQYKTKFVLKIDYTEDFKKTTAAEFLSNLEEHINVKAYMSGKDFRFGAGAKGKSSTLKNYAEDEENGVWYMSVKDVAVDGEKVSTTLIKQYIESGMIQKANALLGREYFVCGEVNKGHGRGRTLGFPTANIVYPSDKVQVKPGVYGVEAEIDGTVYKGVANCGPRPTFGEDAVVLEVFFEGLSEDLYGKTIKVKFLNYIRGIVKFNSAEELSAQIMRDKDMVGAPDNLSQDEPSEEPATSQPAAEEAPAEPAAAEIPAEEPATEQADEPAAEPAAEETSQPVSAEEDDVCDPEGIAEPAEEPTEEQKIVSLVEEVFGGEHADDEAEGDEPEMIFEDEPEEDDAAEEETEDGAEPADGSAEENTQNND